MNSVKFVCTRLQGTGKKGVLKPDSDGYYLLPIGGLDVYNSVGQYYTYQGAKDLFESSSQFQRRVKRGALRGEVGHPQMAPGQSYDDFLARCMNIDDRNICCHFSEVFLDFENFKSSDGKKVIGIMGKVRPSGIHGPALQSALDNPKENVCFSIRSLTRDYMEGTRYNREIKTIVTFDWVNEPGIAHAEKYNSPALETLSEHTFTRSQCERVNSRVQSTIGNESAALNMSELFASMGWDINKNDIPKFTKW